MNIHSFLESETYHTSAACPNGTAEGRTPLQRSVNSSWCREGKKFLAAACISTYVVWSKSDITVTPSHRHANSVLVRWQQANFKFAVRSNIEVAAIHLLRHILIGPI